MDLTRFGLSGLRLELRGEGLADAVYDIETNEVVPDIAAVAVTFRYDRTSLVFELTRNHDRHPWVEPAQTLEYFGPFEVVQNDVVVLRKGRIRKGSE